MRDCSMRYNMKAWLIEIESRHNKWYLMFCHIGQSIRYNLDIAITVVDIFN